MKIKRIFQTVSIAGGVLAVAIFMFLYRPVSLGGDTYCFVVLTGSMQPTIPVGSAVIVKSIEARRLKEGDIICFKSFQEQRSITHRIVRITQTGFITKGDANEEPDPFIIHERNVIGKVVFTIPYLGYLSYIIRTPLGFALLIILPATIIIVREAMDIINHRKKINKTKSGVDSSRPRKKQMSKTIFSMILAFALFSLMFSTASLSWFYDVEVSRDNVISAGVWPYISIYTDKHIYHAGDIMFLGLDVINPDGPMDVCFAVWVVLPDRTIYIYVHMHHIVLPANFSYSNPAFRTITLPYCLPQGTYTWHGALLNPTTHEILYDDTAPWEFTGKIDTKISFDLSPNPATIGQTITLAGNLTDQYSNPISHAPVEVLYSIDNGVTWVYAGTLQTNSTGWFKAKGKLTVIGYYLIKVRYKGTPKYNPSHHIETLTIKSS